MDMVKGPVFRPGDEGYDGERSGFQALAHHRPDVIVGVTDAADVRAAVAHAAAHGLPVAVQATGHGMPIAAEGGLLISTRRMTGVRIDPETATARIEAGVRWELVIEEAARHGLAPLSGSAPSVGAVSYTLGGGLGLMARRYGYAVDQVRAVEVVTADGELREVTAATEPDLFWALLGGRGNFGVVTALEIGLVPVTTLYGGGLFFDLATGAVQRWAEWTQGLPEEMTSSVAVIPFPDAPQVPEVFRGRRVAHVRIAYTGGPREGERLLEPLRAIGPRLVDSVKELPYTESGSIHNDPAEPMAYYATHSLLRELPPQAVDALLETEQAILEIRHLGGALAKPGLGPVVNRDAEYQVGVLSRLAPGGDPGEARPLHQQVREALSPWATGGRSLNFLYGENTAPDQVRLAYDPDDYRRLAALKAVWDAGNLFRLNANIPPA
ncbi:FAD-binding oxidoreductase [Nonomuraea guangzhouensis]|uniref:FAD-binding oxidoreductase n=1 Tax=Nonomuraea guangzhouensis TaxID=1291555 RepID=A0ABW4GQG7_9ACTN|nr:FAD-dependent oxidoreductase [Nonomuraea guangzhouensis]